MTILLMVSFTVAAALIVASHVMRAEG